MSWSRRTLLIALAAAPLGGCGFHPLYGGRTAGAYDPDLAAIKVATIPDRAGQILATSLRERFNPRGVNLPQRYVLNVTLTLARGDLGIQRNATSDRGEVIADADYVLRESTSHKSFSGHVHTVSAFNILPDGYATEVAENDARKRALGDICDDMVTNLSLLMRNQRAASN